MTPKRERKLKTVISNRQPNLGVVLENVFDPHNVSAVMRTCDAVGVQDIYILNTKIPPHKKWGFKSSSSAVKWLSIHQFDNSRECFETLRRRYNKIFATQLNSRSISLYDMDFTQDLAIIFGNEHDGVSEDICSLADGNYVIPQVGIIRSLNISVACAVTLYEAFRQKTVAGHYKKNDGDTVYKTQLRKEWGVE